MRLLSGKENRSGGKNMNKKRWITILLVIAVCLGTVVFGIARSSRGRADRYGSVNDGLSIGLSNVDDIVAGVRTAMLRRADTITIRYQSGVESMEDIEQMVARIMDAAMEETGDPQGGDYLRYQNGGYEAHYQYGIDKDRYVYTIDIKPNYYTDAAEEERVTREIESILEGFAFTSGTSEDEKIRTIYDFVRSNVEYDYMHSRITHYHRKATAYAALFDHKAVCQGFSVLLYRLLQESGIDCRIITGTADDGTGPVFHSWNIVKAGDKYYNMDVTWDAQIGSRQFYLLSEADFIGHSRDTAFASETFYEVYPMGEESLLPEEERPDIADLINTETEE